MFDVGGTAKVKTYAEMTLQLELDDSAPFEEVGKDAPTTAYESITARKGMFVPPKLVNYVNNKSVPPGRLLMKVHALIKDEDGLKTAWKPLTGWLRMACMSNGRTHIKHATPALVPTLTPLLIVTTKSKVQEDL